MNQIKTAFPSLPQVLDLLESPSYSNTKKLVIHRPKPRTATTNSTPKVRENRTPQAGTTFRKTDSTFYSPTTTINNSFQFEPYCFSELKTISRPLKKLYSSKQHEVLKKKLGELHEKYSNLYDERTEEEASPERFQELYLNAEKMFNTSYSVKYIGLQNDQLGITSQRLPMNLSKDFQPEVTSKSLSQAIRTSQKKPRRFLRQNSSKDSSLAGWKHHVETPGNNMKAGVSLLLGRSVINSPKFDVNKTFSEISKDRVEHSHDITCDDPPEAKEVNTTGIFDENKNSSLLGEKSPCIVTKYFLPKKTATCEKEEL